MTFHKAFLALATVSVLQGCASALTPLGENYYDCNRKENPASPYCHSFKSVESATTGTLPPSRFDQAMSVADHDRLTGIAPTVGGKPGAAPLVPGAGTMPGAAIARADGVGVAAPSLEGLPVRVGPVVQRIWVKRFVDDNDLLVGETVIYKEIVGSHWLGFDGSAGSATSSGKTSGAYPHRPADPSASPLGRSGPDLNSRAAPARSRSEFAQPGARAPESSGVVSSPATEAPPSESGVTSMPQ